MTTPTYDLAHFSTPELLYIPDAIILQMRIESPGWWELILDGPWSGAYGRPYACSKDFERLAAVAANISTRVQCPVRIIR